VGCIDSNYIKHPTRLSVPAETKKNDLSLPAKRLFLPFPLRGYGQDTASLRGEGDPLHFRTRPSPRLKRDTMGLDMYAYNHARFSLTVNARSLLISGF
jgi:hypothetical protein